jgi:hypothetical protein
VASLDGLDGRRASGINMPHVVIGKSMIVLQISEKVDKTVAHLASTPHEIEQRHAWKSVQVPRWVLKGVSSLAMADVSAPSKRGEVPNS